MAGRGDYDGYQPPAYNYRDNALPPTSDQNGGEQALYPSSNPYTPSRPSFAASTDQLYPPSNAAYLNSQTNLRTPSNMASNKYNNLDAPSPWLEKQRSGGRRSKWIIIGSIVGLLGLIGIGVGVGVAVSRHNSNNSTTNSPSNSSSGSGILINGSDPSQFEKDPNLYQSFYGLAYSPANVQLPECGATLEEVVLDIQLLSQLTTRIRMYGADCNQSSLVLAAIELTKVNMTVNLANYIELSDGGVAYERQKGEIMTALQMYGDKNVNGYTIGNEVMLDYLNSISVSDPNSPEANSIAPWIISNITDGRNTLQQAGYNIKIGNAEAGSYFNDEVLKAIDQGFCNDHPMFAGVEVDVAADWTWNFFETQNVEVAASVSPSTEMIIAEVGWASAEDNNGTSVPAASVPSIPNLQTFLDTWVCQANANGTEYYFFEFMDEEWKEPQYGGVEAHWGLFYSNRTLKPITIPNCTLS